MSQTGCKIIERLRTPSGHVPPLVDGIDFCTFPLIFGSPLNDVTHMAAPKSQNGVKTRKSKKPADFFPSCRPAAATSQVPRTVSRLMYHRTSEPGRQQVRIRAATVHEVLCYFFLILSSVFKVASGLWVCSGVPHVGCLDGNGNQPSCVGLFFAVSLHILHQVVQRTISHAKESKEALEM